MRAFAEIESRRPEEWGRIKEMAQGGEDGEGDGEAALYNLLKRKRKHKLGKERKHVYTAAEVKSEVLRQGFIETNDEMLRSIGEELGQCFPSMRHKKPLLGGYYFLGMDEGLDEKGATYCTTVIGVRSTLINIYNALCVEEVDEENVVLGIDGHYKSCRGCFTFIVVGVCHCLYGSDNRTTFTVAPLLGALALNESAKSVSFLLERLRAVVETFRGTGKPYKGPRHIICDASPSIIGGTRIALPASTCRRCHYHHIESCKKSGNELGQHRRAAFLIYLRRIVANFYACCTEDLYMKYIGLLLPEVKYIFGSGMWAHLKSSWNGLQSHGVFHGPSILRLAAEKTAPVSVPSFNNIMESLFASMRSRFLGKQRFATFAGDKGYLAACKDFLTANGACSRGGKYEAHISVRKMSAPHPMMVQRAARRRDFAKQEGRSVLTEVKGVVEGDVRVFCISSFSKRDGREVTEEEALQRVQLEAGVNIERKFVTATEFEELVFGVHVLASTPSEEKDEPLCYCTCLSFGKFTQCSHCVLLKWYLMVEEGAGDPGTINVNLPVHPKAGRPTKSKGALVKHKTDIPEEPIGEENGRADSSAGTADVGNAIPVEAVAAADAMHRDDKSEEYEKISRKTITKRAVSEKRSKKTSSRAKPQALHKLPQRKAFKAFEDSAAGVSAPEREKIVEDRISTREAVSPRRSKREHRKPDWWRANNIYAREA
ncbi:hypothetical protein FOZ60_017238 [Perkinsus olseni]|uniref:SWIM-type domain-containing protein n=1 Tax=Perkinsus olseni TaxID=32597 RepID=A0A7J6N147_PEROL|nr:hypothetical protein FOZ60_017238 [Perkinsus olseni]